MNSRELALHIIRETLEKEGQSHLLLQQCFQTHPGLDSRERGFITALVHGTIGHALLLDAYLAQLCRQPLEALKPLVRHLLRMSLYQLFFMDRIPPSAVCNEAVKLTRKYLGEGLTGFVNGVLRAAARKNDWVIPQGAEALSLPPDLYQYLTDLYGRQETERLARFFLAPSPLWGRVNTARTRVQAVQEMLAREGYEALPAPDYPAALRLRKLGEEAPALEAVSAWQQGLIQLQDISSQLAVLAAAPRRGMQVLDMCGAPGGKSLQAADLMQDDGAVMACDISPYKCGKIEENIKRSGFRCIQTAVADALVFDPGKEAAFDLVMADLPCSGLGVAGRKAEIKYRVKQAQIESLAALQRAMLAQGARYVKPGGTLLFSTCTLSREENQDNACWLEESLGLKPLPISLPLPEAIRAKRMPAPHMLQLLPGDLDGDGFFISLFQKV